MQCGDNGRCRIFARPDAACAFDVMDKCERHFDTDDLKQACIEGARDAHLLSSQRYVYSTDTEQQAYDSAHFTTFYDCSDYHPITIFPQQ